MTAALSSQVTVRPVLLRTISPASDSTSRCFMIAGSDTGNGLASSLTDRPWCSPSRAISARRVGSASAPKVLSRRVSEYLTIRLSVMPREKPVNAAARIISDRELISEHARDGPGQPAVDRGDADEDRRHADELAQVEMLVEQLDAEQNGADRNEEGR